jgi:argininosuccinate lyase
MNIEARLIELIGPLGGKLHTGRSRNDQVATDLRLYTRKHSKICCQLVHELLATLTQQAQEHLDLLMPGYTHLQRAQPIRFSHHLLAWLEMIERDLGRLLDGIHRLNELPLGAGALAGTTFPIDRHQVAQELGFERPMRNSLDATGSRDFLMEITCSLAILGVHLSRIGEELVLWSSQEFGFIELSDAFSTGSSMMPQKKNPDVAELVRGRSARVIGDAVNMLVLEKGLPFGYNRDLQEDKTPMFDAFQTIEISLQALQGALASMKPRPERMKQALKQGFVCATEVADYLASKGVPFREAHEITGKLVKIAIVKNCGLEDLSLSEFQELSAQFEKDIFHVLDPNTAVERRIVAGGPAKARVQEAIQDSERRLALSHEKISNLP